MPVIAIISDIDPEVILQETWGHLAPRDGQVYAGHYLAAASCFGGEIVVINFDFGTLDSSPWFYDGIYHHISQTLSSADPGVYRFDGHCWRTPDGDVRFEGAVTPAPLPGARAEAPR